MRLPNFKITSDLNTTQVEMNGEKLKFVKSVSIYYNIGDFPEVTLTFLAGKVDVSAMMVDLLVREPKNENETL